MAYPNTLSADYDLFGALLNQRTLTLVTSINSTDVAVDFGSTVDDIVLPSYIRFATGEIIKVDYYNPTHTGFNSVTRGFGGTTATSHTAGEGAYIVLTAEHFHILRDAVSTLQRYRALRVTDIANFSGSMLTDSKEGKLALSDAGILKIKIDSSAVNFSAEADHGAYTNLDADDHTQYMNSARFVSRHATYSGGHVQDGDTHNHLIGTGVGRVSSGTSKPATPGYAGRIYYDTALRELWVGQDATTWVKITGAPSGTIIMLFEADAAGACPPGWVRFTALDGRFPKGAVANQLPSATPGGVSTHQHTYSQVPVHSHTIALANVSTGTDGSHSHSVPASYNCCGSGLAVTANRVDNMGGGTSDSGNHYHTYSVPATATGAPIRTGLTPQTSGLTGSSSNLPPYQEVIFCVKS